MEEKTKKQDGFGIIQYSVFIIHSSAGSPRHEKTALRSSVLEQHICLLTKVHLPIIWENMHTARERRRLSVRDSRWWR